MKIHFRNESFEILKLYLDGSAWSFEAHFFDAPRIAQQLSKVKAEFQCINSFVEVGASRIATMCFQFLKPCWTERSYFPNSEHWLTAYGQPVARCTSEEALAAANRLFRG